MIYDQTGQERFRVRLTADGHLEFRFPRKIILALSSEQSFTVAKRGGPL